MNKEPEALPPDFNKGRPGRRKGNTKFQPVLFDYCVTTYTRMLQQANSMPVVEGMDELGDPIESEMIVWEGMLTRLITGDLKYSTPYYSHITSLLKGMGCIAMLRRGGGSTPSQWEMIKEPTIEAFEACKEKMPSATTRSSANKQIEQTVRILNDRVTALEEALQAFLHSKEATP